MQNNPIRYTDPTGHYRVDDPYGGGGTTPPIPPQGNPPEDGEEGGHPQADVTEWLVGEMDIEASWLDRNVNCGWDQICLYKTHLNLFGDYKKYDIKRSMLSYIGDAVVLCNGATCRWVDYSTPGNIMFGYLSASRGVPQSISWVAAGYLEISNSIESGQPYTGTLEAWGDNPGDKAAVDFGYALYEMYPQGITVEDFSIALTQEILESFQAPSIMPAYPANPAPANTYPVDYFFWPIEP